MTQQQLRVLAALCVLGYFLLIGYAVYTVFTKDPVR